MINFNKYISPKYKDSLNELIKISQNIGQENYYLNHNFIPLKISLKTNGLSGIRVGTLLKIKDDSLPKKYTNDNLVYAVIGISHSLNNKWETQLSLQPIIIDGGKINKPFDRNKIIYIRKTFNNTYLSLNVPPSKVNDKYKNFTINQMQRDNIYEFTQPKLSPKGYEVSILPLNAKETVHLLKNKITPPSYNIRLYDGSGSGLFLESRDGGSRAHLGIDFALEKDKEVKLCCDAIFLQYSNTSIYFKDKTENIIYQYMHIDRLLTLKTGKEYSRGEIIGKQTDLSKIYNKTKHKNMMNHIHFQIYVPQDNKNIFSGHRKLINMSLPFIYKNFENIKFPYYFGEDNKTKDVNKYLLVNENT